MLIINYLINLVVTIIITYLIIIIIKWVVHNKCILTNKSFKTNEMRFIIFNLEMNDLDMKNYLISISYNIECNI